MIQITRSLAKNCRAVFRRLARKHIGAVVFQATGDGLRIGLLRTEILAQFHQPGAFAEEVIALPWEVLADFEGRTDESVALEAAKDGNITARWQDGNLPRVMEYSGEDISKLPTPPDLPRQMIRSEPVLLKALADASESAAKFEGTRYALHHLQLRGPAGTVVATDGHQLLVQSGFNFGWQEDVLMPASAVFGCHDLSTDADVKIGKTDKNVVVTIGAWTFWLPVNQEARFPHTEEVIPAAKRFTTRWRLASEDADFLDRALPRLPGGDDENAPITLDLNGQAIIRAKAEGQNQVTEVILAGSEVTGEPVRMQVNRNLLGRAIRLGFREFSVVDADTPVLAQDDHRQFIAMPLGKAGALPPKEDAVRVSSAESRRKSHSVERKKFTMTTTNAHGTGAGNNGNGAAGNDTAAAADPHGKRRRQAKGAGLAGLIKEAELLKSSLRDAFSRSHQLLRAIKRHRKQSQTVQSALRTLKDLQSVDG